MLKCPSIHLFHAEWIVYACSLFTEGAASAYRIAQFAVCRFWMYSFGVQAVLNPAGDDGIRTGGGARAVIISNNGAWCAYFSSLFLIHSQLPASLSAVMMISYTAHNLKECINSSLGYVHCDNTLCGAWYFNMHLFVLGWTKCTPHCCSHPQCSGCGWTTDEDWLSPGCCW